MRENAEAAREPDSICPAGLHSFRPDSSSNIIFGTMKYSSGKWLHCYDAVIPSGMTLGANTLTMVIM